MYKPTKQDTLYIYTCINPQNKKCLANGGSLLANRLRRWPSISSSFVLVPISKNIDVVFVSRDLKNNLKAVHAYSRRRLQPNIACCFNTHSESSAIRDITGYVDARQLYSAKQIGSRSTLYGNNKVLF